MIAYVIRFILLLALCIASVSSTDTLKYEVYGKVLQTGEKVNLGHLDIFSDYTGGYYTGENIESYSEFCVGVEGLKGHECIGIAESPRDIEFAVNLKQNGDFGFLSLTVPSDSSAQISNTQEPQIPYSHNIIVMKTSPIPSPNLKPNNIPKKQLQKAAKSTNEGSNNDDDPELEKSWIQKNWMYIVPPLLILFVLMGDEEKK